MVKYVPVDRHEIEMMHVEVSIHLKTCELEWEEFKERFVEARPHLLTALGILNKDYPDDPELDSGEEDVEDPKDQAEPVDDRAPHLMSKEEVQEMVVNMQKWAKYARQFRMNTATAQAMGGQAYHGVPVEIDDTLKDGQVVYDKED